MLKCLFALPPGHDGALINQMLGLVMAYIDLLGGYKLGPEQKKRSEKVCSISRHHLSVNVSGLQAPRAGVQPAEASSSMRQQLRLETRNMLATAARLLV